jgi:hypothetical protein
MSGIVSKFANLCNIEKIRHEQQMLQFSYDEIKEKLEEDTKDGKNILSDLTYAGITLHLRMLEIKIAMANNSISKIRSSAIGTPGDINHYNYTSCWGCGRAGRAI